MTPILQAIPTKNPFGLMELVESDPPPSLDTQGMTPLAQAVNAQFHERVKLLIEAKANPNEGSPPPISLAVTFGDMNMLKLLDTEQTDFQVTDTQNRTLLHLAARSQQAAAEKVTFLLEKKVDINSKDQSGQTAIEAAIEFENVKAFTCLLEAGASWNIKSDTPEVLKDLFNFYHDLD